MTPNAPLPAASPRCDSWTADLVIADDQGGTTVLPADPEALASYLAECRRLERRSSDAPEEKTP
jgi:hypothetical protein